MKRIAKLYIVSYDQFFESFKKYFGEIEIKEMYEYI